MQTERIEEHRLVAKRRPFAITPMRPIRHSR
jgi:hypothetical protein